MSSQRLLQVGAVVPHPATDLGVIEVETTLLQQFLSISQRKRIAKIPTDCTKHEDAFGLPPFEDCGPGYRFAILSYHRPASLQLQNIRTEGEPNTILGASSLRLTVDARIVVIVVEQNQSCVIRDN